MGKNIILEELAANNDDHKFKASLFIEMNGFLKPADVCKIVSLSGSEIHRLRKEGRFPEPETIKGNAKGYRAKDIIKWLNEREGWKKEA